MGNCNEAESFRLASQSDHLPAVVRGIIGLVEKPGQLRKGRILTKSGKLYVTYQAVLSYIREINQEMVSERAMEGVIKSLMVTSTPAYKDGLYYQQIDPADILNWADPHGCSSPKLHEMHDFNVANGRA